MKKNVLLALASLFCLSCCGRSEKEVSPSSEQVFPLQFSIRMEAEILPFRATKGIPPLDIPEPTPKNPDEEEPSTPPEENTDELYTYIDYLVFQADKPNSLVKRKRYTPDDADFGIVYDSLPAGEYQLCFLAHSDKDISITGQTATFHKVSDTFLAFLSQSVQSGEGLVQDIDLNRIVSRVEFVASDAVPENLKSLDMQINGFQNKINLCTGQGISENTPAAQTYTFLPEDIGKTRLSYSFYTFIPADNQPLSVRLSAYDKEEKPLREREIGDITPIRNRVVRYTGKLYTPSGEDDTFTLQISNDGKWDDPIENELND